MRSLILLSIFIFSGTNSAQACPFRAYLDFEKQGPNRKTEKPVAATSEWLQQLDQLFQQGVQLTFQLYQSEQLNTSDFQCVEESDRLKDQIETEFSSPFLIEAVRSLEQSSSQHIQSIAQQIKNYLSSGSLNPSRLNLHLSTAARPAGFDRSNHGLFFNLFQIEPKNFNLYLIHEFAHAFDQHLANAIVEFNDETLTETIAEMVRSQKTFKQLSATEKEAVKKYLLAGLNRGVLAELRAWLKTSELYLELLQNCEQTPVSFIDEIIGIRRNLTRDELTQTWWKYLLRNFGRPKSGLFVSPLLKDALDEILRDLNPKDWA